MPPVDTDSWQVFNAWYWLLNFDQKRVSQWASFLRKVSVWIPVTEVPDSNPARSLVSLAVDVPYSDSFEGIVSGDSSPFVFSLELQSLRDRHVRSTDVLKWPSVHS